MWRLCVFSVALSMSRNHFFRRISLFGCRNAFTTFQMNATMYLVGYLDGLVFWDSCILYCVFGLVDFFIL